MNTTQTLKNVESHYSTPKNISKLPPPIPPKKGIIQSSTTTVASPVQRSGIAPAVAPKPTVKLNNGASKPPVGPKPQIAPKPTQSSFSTAKVQTRNPVIKNASTESFILSDEDMEFVFRFRDLRADRDTILNELENRNSPETRDALSKELVAWEKENHWSEIEQKHEQLMEALENQQLKELEQDKPPQRPTAPKPQRLTEEKTNLNSIKSSVKESTESKPQLTPPVVPPRPRQTEKQEAPERLTENTKSEPQRQTEREPSTIKNSENHYTAIVDWEELRAQSAKEQRPTLENFNYLVATEVIPLSKISETCNSIILSLEEQFNQTSNPAEKTKIKAEITQWKEKKAEFQMVDRDQWHLLRQTLGLESREQIQPSPASKKHKTPKSDKNKKSFFKRLFSGRSQEKSPVEKAKSDRPLFGGLFRRQRKA